MLLDLSESKKMSVQNMTLFVHINGFFLQVLACYVAKIAQLSVCLWCSIPAARTAVWTDWGRRSVPPGPRWTGCLRSS